MTESKQPASTSPPANMLPGSHWGRIGQEEALRPPADNNVDNDSVDNDSDSTYSDIDSSTASISSSIFAYRTLNGRRYHSDRLEGASYWGTNDEPHNEALDISHHFMLVLRKNKLHLAPLDKDKIQAAVDIGTGTGIWAIDFADAYPNASVVGTDISPIQPAWVPPNLKFEIDDCTKPWTFAPSSLDFVHIRWLSGCVVDWHALYREAFRSLRPNGYLEAMEPAPYLESDDDSIPPDSAIGQWSHIFSEGGRRMGRSMTVAVDGTLRQAMEEAGFVDIQEIDDKVPLGGWWPGGAGDPEKDDVADYERYRIAGQYAGFALLQDIEGVILFMLTKVFGWTHDEVSVFAAQTRKQLKSGKCHPYYRIKTLIGRKPEESRGEGNEQTE